MFKEISDPTFLLRVKSIVFIIVCVLTAMALELGYMLLAYEELRKHARDWICVVSSRDSSG